MGKSPGSSPSTPGQKVPSDSRDQKSSLDDLSVSPVDTLDVWKFRPTLESDSSSCESSVPSGKWDFKEESESKKSSSDEKERLEEP